MSSVSELSVGVMSVCQVSEKGHRVSSAKKCSSPSYGFALVFA